MSARDVKIGFKGVETRTWDGENSGSFFPERTRNPMFVFATFSTNTATFTPTDLLNEDFDSRIYDLTNGRYVVTPRTAQDMTADVLAIVDVKGAPQ